MSPLGEPGKEAIKTNASRKSCNQCSKKKKTPFVFCVELSSFSPVSLCFPLCLYVLEALNSVEGSSNVSIPVEMAAVCSIVVIDWCGVWKDGLLCTWRQEQKSLYEKPIAFLSRILWWEMHFAASFSPFLQSLWQNLSRVFRQLGNMQLPPEGHFSFFILQKLSIMSFFFSLGLQHGATVTVPTVTIQWSKKVQYGCLLKQ